MFEIDRAVGVRLDGLDLIAAEARRGRIGAVRRVGDQRDVSRGVAARFEAGADHHEAGHLAVRAGGRLQTDAGQTRDLGQRVFKLLDHFQSALRQLVGLTGASREAVDARHALVEPRVVLHRARAERVHPEIDRVVPRREPREVADDVDLADFGQPARSSSRSSFGSIRARSAPLRRRAPAACSPRAPAANARRSDLRSD